MRIELEGIEELQRALDKLEDNELPTVMRNSLNDVAFGVKERQEREVQRVFEAPVRAVQRPFYVKKATKQKLEAKLDIKDRLPFLDRVFEPHIPGRPATRHHTAFEWRLQNAGLLGADEYMVPSRTQRKNTFGNVTRGTYSKMLADLRVYREAGFEGNTKRQNRGFMWAAVGPKYSRNKIRGIWYIARLRDGRPGALAMMVVKRPPTYAKRFRFEQVAQSHGAKIAPDIILHELEWAVERRLRRSR